MNTASLGTQRFLGASWAVKLVGLALLAFAVAYCSIWFTKASGRTAAIWPLNAIFLVMLLRSPRTAWPGLLGALFLGNMAANVWSSDPIVRAAMFACANLMEVLIVGVAMTRRGSVRLLRRASIIRFAKASLIGCAASTLIAATTLAASGMDLPLREAAIWFAADILGLLLFTPVVWIMACGAGARSLTGEDLQMAPELGLLVVATLAVFLQSHYPLLFLVPPALVLLAIRRGLAGATAGIVLITVLGLGFTLVGHGPTNLINGDLQVRILVLQVFLAANALMGLAVGASSAERRRLIGRLKAAKARIGERSERERLLIEQARLAERMGQVGYWTLKPSSGEVFWSPEVYQIHGVTPDNFHPALGDALAFYSDDDRAMIAAEIERCLALKTGWQFEADLRKATGESIRVRSMAECRINGSGDVEMIFGVFKDITHDHQMLERVKEQQELYQLLADNSSDVIARYGTDSIFTYLSPSIETVLGYKPEDLVGRSTATVIHPDDLEMVLETWRSGLKSVAPFSVEYRAVHRDGTIMWLEARPTISRDETGAIVGFIDTVRDVTERHERELALANATAIAEAATQAKADFLSTMSHEIRTPLNGVLGFADLLARSDISPEQRRYVSRIDIAGKALLHVVNDVLDFSKIEAGMMTVELSPYDPIEILEGVVELVKAAHPGSDVVMTSNATSFVAKAYSGDEGRVRQILLNVIGNAAKFTQEGSIRTEVSIDKDRLRFTVSDTGPGIAPDRLDNIFEGFSQADQSISRKFGGTGLGLSISRSLARLMEGDITVTSALGQGTTVTLDLPAVPTAPIAEAMPVSISMSDVSGLRVMVVDDIEMNRELLEIGLGEAGHSVSSFESGEAAIEALSKGAIYDVILMDVQMPGMDGLSATRIIRRLPGAPAEVPIIGLTANVLPEQAAACQAAGMDDHFGKPVSMGHLLAFMERLGSRRLSAEPQSNGADTYDNPALEALKRRYAEHLAGVPDELEHLLQNADLAMCGNAVAALAHSIAGTSGSFGFSAVSDAAFQLEAAGRRAGTLEATHKELQLSVEALVQTIKVLPSIGSGLPVLASGG